MTRVIEVSHWGNIAVEETLDLYHSGAVLKGSFSRYDYQRQQDGAASIKSFKVSVFATNVVKVAVCLELKSRESIGMASSVYRRLNGGKH